MTGFALSNPTTRMEAHLKIQWHYLTMTMLYIICEFKLTYFLQSTSYKFLVKAIISWKNINFEINTAILIIREYKHFGGK